MSQLDANGKEVPSPELAMLARMPAATRDQMAAAMKARGVQLPDENGMMKACLTKETLSSDGWQQVAADTGCTTTYSVRSNSTWKWHTSCPTLKSESDGETTFTAAEAYRTKMTTTSTMTGKPVTSTRIVEGKWVGAACGDVQPIAPPPARGR